MNKLIISTSLIVLTTMSSQADDKLTTSGYIDLSYSSVELDGEDSTSRLALDNFHVNLNYQLSDKLLVSGHVAGGSDEDFDLEQAHFVYSVDEHFSFIAGKFLSAQGWEAFHAPDMYQNSYSATLLYPAMMNGVGAKYANDSFSIYGAVMSSAWDSTDTDMDDMAYEGAIKITSIPNVTVHLGFTSEDFATGYTQSLTNFWASYAIDNLTLAIEYNAVSDWGGDGNDGSGWLAMVNYAFTHKAAITIRTSALDIETFEDTGITDNSKWTISPSYAITEDWLVLAEYNVLTNDISGRDTKYFAIESTIAF